MPRDCWSQQDSVYEEEEFPSSALCVAGGFQYAPEPFAHIIDFDFDLCPVSLTTPGEKQANRILAMPGSWGPTLLLPYTWDVGMPLQNRFSVLDDWATALHAQHVKDAVHGNLTPESVGIVHGKGTLRTPSLAHLPGHEVLRTRESADDDVYGARWAATELFHISNGNPTPTKMSDVYSFACLMLQMLTGEVPYCGTRRPEQVVYLKYLGREPIDTQTPKVADHYVAFMHLCWSPEPEKRPTMESVVEFIHGERRKLAE